MKLKLIIIYLYLQGLDVVHILESIKLICSHNFFEWILKTIPEELKIIKYKS